MMRWQSPLVVLLVVACVLAQAAARNGKPDDEALTKGFIYPDAALLDSYIQMLNPGLAIADQQTGREGRTTLTVQLTDSSVSKFTPVVAPQTQGITVDVLNTWEALKNVAAAYRQAELVNKQSTSSQPLFPRTSLAARAASIAQPVELQSLASSASTLLPFPPNLLMVPFGHTTAAIAEVMDAVYDDLADAVTLQLDVVHDPVTFSQFTPHQPCTVHTDEAHFHFATRPGMSVDSQKLLQALKGSDFKTDGLHVFLKSEPLQVELSATLTPDSAQLAVGDSLRVNVSVTATSKKGPGPSVGTALDLQLTGPGTITETSPDTSANKQSRHADTATAYTDENGDAYFVVKALGAGEIVVDVSAQAGKLPTPLGSITIQVGGAVSDLLLLPAKCYRRCSDPATLTVVALNSTGGPVPGVNVSLAMFGDCSPDYTDTVITGADGKALVTVQSPLPGGAAVVAAAHGPGGDIVISAPSHVFFFKDHGDMDRHEHEYYGGDEGDSGPYDGPHRHGGARRYEREAAKLASQRALNLPVSGSS